MSYSLRLVSNRGSNTLRERLIDAGVTPEGVDIMASKAGTVVIRVDRVPAAAANIIKQQLLSIGGDAAVHREVITGRPESSSVYMIADPAKFRTLMEKLEYQPFGLDGMAAAIPELLERHSRPASGVSLPSGNLDFTEGPAIMGILNVTPDSFSDGGLWLDPGAACEKAHSMAEKGASIIDIGGESSRPGAAALDQMEEIGRIMPVLERLAGSLEVPVSIDTRKSAVARAAVDSGASIINDISGLRHDPQMLRTVVESGAAVIVMHMRGDPETMQDDPSYGDAAAEIIDWLDERTVEIAAAGIGRDKIIIDPGIGFGKRLKDNLEIIDRAGDFHTLGFPVAMGYSRKSFLGMITGNSPEERVWGGFAALARCLDGGVQIVRVHDVRETRDFIKVWKALDRKDIQP